MLKSVNNYQVEILLTLALVTGGYAVANRIGISGPLAMVVAGLLIGNQGRAFAMSERTRARLDDFWELVDDFMNAVLFVFIGVEVLVVEFRSSALIAGLAAIPAVLAARWISVALPVAVMKRFRSFSAGAVPILTWTGLRGAISVALALSLPPGSSRDLIITMTYIVVVFSIAVQGLTAGRVARHFARG
jgi:monovalent cation:H+ antiporter, CPA1 family